MFGQPLLQWNSSNYCIFPMRVCSLTYAALNGHAPYYYLWPVRPYPISPHYLTNGTIFEKILNIKCVFWFYLQLFVWQISHFKNWARYDQKCFLVFMWSTRHFCQILMKLELSLHIFLQKIFRYKISRKFDQWEPSCSIRTDWQTGRR